MVERKIRAYKQYFMDFIKSIRPEEARKVFFVFDEGNVVLLMNGFQKKSQKTPKKELDLAKRLKKEYYNEKGK